MKALLITGIYKPDIGGPATYIPKLASRLTELDIEVEVITLKNSSSVISFKSSSSFSDSKFISPVSSSCTCVHSLNALPNGIR